MVSLKQHACLGFVRGFYAIYGLDSKMPLLVTVEISRPYLVSVAEQTGLSPTWSKIPKTLVFS